MMHNLRILLLEEEAATYESLARMKAAIVKIERLIQQAERLGITMPEGDTDE